jgi:APA family basic amino acid/polyamine antiporter
VVLVTVINIFGLKTGSLVQNVFTTAKAAALAGLIIFGFVAGSNVNVVAQNFGSGWTHFWHNASASVLHPVQVGADGPMVLVGMLTVLAVAQVGSLFSADAWNNVTFTAGEVRNPSRNLPLSLALGTGSVLAMYILANFVYLTVLPLHGDPNGTTVLARGIQFAQEDRVGTAVLEQIFHSAGAYVMAGAILISTFGCANGLVLAGARVYYAMSKDGLFFKAAGDLHPRSRVPVASLVAQCVWTSLLCISGSYGQLLDYTIFAALLFYILTIGSLFVLRVRQPNASRPYRAFGYPVLPALYIVMAIWISAVLLRYKPQYTWPGLAIVLCGIPVYLVWSARNRRLAP